ncbi:MAG: hypothetical protein AAGD43_07495 [Pseudomonadota bacterium]
MEDQKLDEQHKDRNGQNRDFGVFTAKIFYELLPQHQKIMLRVVSKIVDLGREERQTESAYGVNGEADYVRDIAGRQPHLTFLIDGPKGSGKTTLLVNLKSVLECLGPHNQTKDIPNKALADGVLEQFENAAEFSDVPDELSTWNVHEHPRKLVHALPVIRPDAMETSETIIESVFAEMTAQIESKRKVARQSESFTVWSEQDWHKGEPPELKVSQKAEELKDDLHRNVAKGWYFARRMGVEALMNDSLDFDEYISRRAAEAAVSHRRIAHWSKFVTNYLSFFEAQFLGIFIDDTDVSAELTADLVHSIRMFFSHPRIVIVMAGNLHTMRQRLLARAMTVQSEALRGLRDTSSFTAKFWRDFERDNLEEYLSKVLPRPYRHFISSSTGDTQHLLANDKTFADFCTEEMEKRIEDYLKDRQTTRMRNQSDAQVRSARYEQLLGVARQPNFQVESENFISLWLLRNHYAEALTPPTARHMNQFRAMVERPTSGTDWQRSRRVIVALFTQPNNSAIVQRQTDYEADAAAWINQQRVSSCWRGARWIKINELKIPAGTPAYDQMLFRLDLELAKPASSRLDINIPFGLLPEPAGRKVWAPEIWETDSRDDLRSYLNLLDQPGEPTWQFVELPNHEVRLRQDLQGIGRTLSSPVIPANCLYFKDLRSIPDVAWIWDEETDDDYRRRFGQFPVRNIDNLFRLDRYDPRNHYFREIVLVFASFPLSQPVPTSEFIDDSQPLHVLELKQLRFNGDASDKQTTSTSGRSNNQGAEQRDTRILQFEQLIEISNILAERYKVIFIGNDKPLLSISRKDVSRLKASQLKSEKPIKGAMKTWSNDLPDPANIISKLIPRYHRILNDVRRSNHALRILEQDLNNYAHIGKVLPDKSKGADGSSYYSKSRNWPSPFNHSRNDRYALMSLDKFRSVMGLPSIRRSYDLAEGTLKKDIKYHPGPTDLRYWVPISARDGKRDNLEQPFSRCISEALFPERDYAEDQVTLQSDNRLPANRRGGLFLGKLCPNVNERSNKRRSSLETWTWRFTLVRPDPEEAPQKDLNPEEQKLYELLKALFAERDWSAVREDGTSLECGTDNENERKSFAQVLCKSVIYPDDNEWETMDEILKGHLIDSKRLEDSDRSRALRSILLFLWGTAPCLPSIIHLEIMGRYYRWARHYGRCKSELESISNAIRAANQQGANNRERRLRRREARLLARLRPEFEICVHEISEHLDDWEITLAYSISSVVALATSLEYNLKQDLSNFDAPVNSTASGASQADDEDSRPMFSPLPDMQISALGLRLFMHDDGRESDETNLKFSGVIGDVLLRLQLSLYYIQDLRRTFRGLVNDKEALKALVDQFNQDPTP